MIVDPDKKGGGIGQHQPALWKTNPKYRHTNEIRFCKNCNDTAYVLIEDNKVTNRCCRCGEDFKSDAK